MGPRWIRRGNETLSVDHWVVDENFLEVFDFPLQEGEMSGVLRHPWSLVVTRDLASRLFGEEDPVGKWVNLEHVWFGGEYMVTGILASLPTQSTMQFDALSSTIPDSGTAYHAWEDWSDHLSWIPVQTWLKIGQGDESAVEEELNALMASHLGPETTETDAYRLQKLTRIHLYGTMDYGTSLVWEETSTGPDIRVIYAAIIVVIVVMLIASANFANLAIARSVSRTPEVGLRRTIGAGKWQVFIQFTIESVILAFIALAVSVPAAKLISSVFAELIGSEFEVSLGTVLTTMPRLCVAALCLGVLSGVYPAVLLSRLVPNEALRGNHLHGSRKEYLRAAVLTFQFAASVVLVIVAGAMSTQVDFVKNVDLGYEEDNVVLLPLFEDSRGAGSHGDAMVQNYRNIKRLFLDLPSVVTTSAVHTQTGLGGPTEILRSVQNPDGIRVKFLGVDEDFLNTYQIPLVEGRNFRNNMSTDRTAAFIVNKTAAEILGGETAIGEQVSLGNRSGLVIGVVRDFHNRSLHTGIGPVVMAMRESLWNTLAVRVTGDALPSAIDHLKTIWQEVLPERPFRYVFLSDMIAEQYRATERFAKLCAWLAVLATVIAWIGFYGLLSYLIERRRKEIGVRRVLGASNRVIVLQLALTYTKPVIYGTLIGSPVALLVIQWLRSDFAYSADIGWLHYGGGIFTILFIAVVTVVYYGRQSLRKDLIYLFKQD